MENTSHVMDLSEMLEENIEDMDFSHATQESFDIDEDVEEVVEEELSNDLPDEGAEEEDVLDSGDETSDEDDISKSLKDDLEGDAPEVAKAEEGGDDFESLKKEIQDLYDDPKAGIRFAELKQELKQAKADAQSIREGSVQTPEMEELRAKATLADELQGKLDETRQRLMQVDYESTPEYEAAVVAPFRDLETAASQIDAANGLEEGTTIKAISNADQSTQDAAIANLEHSLSARSVSRLNTLADQYLILNQKAQVARNEAEVRMKEHQDSQVSLSAEQAEKTNLAYRSSVGGIFDKYEGKLPGFVGDDGSVNEAYTAAKESALAVDFNKMDEGSAAQAMFASKVLPELVSQLQQTQAELKTQKQMTRRLSASKPSLGSSPKSSPAPRKAASNPFALDAESDERFTIS